MNITEAIDNIEQYAPKPKRLPTIAELEKACEAMTQIEEIFGGKSELQDKSETV